jgi:oxygen-independent coproporphyrinogen-3 oxidase
MTPTPSSSAETQRRLDLARRYACRGPRYTSYPTAPHFSEDFPLQDYLALRERERDSTAPLSLYVHVPFCHNICYYCACNKVVTRKPGVAGEYLDHLEREIALQSALIGGRRPVTQMHWGGGTPTYLDSGELTRLMHALARHFHLLDSPDREYAIEIDPRTVDRQAIALLRGLGFNRLSLGIQDFDDRVQRAINRVQSFESVASLMQCARDHDFQSISVDLIYGLPYQDVDSMRSTLDKVLALKPDRIACYNYAHLPERFKPQRSIDRLTLPTPDAKLRLADHITTTRDSAGYCHIGMDHYVLPHDELALAQEDGRLQRNFQGYSLQLADDLLGLGVSAISQIGDFYLQNARELPDYYAALDAQQLPLARGYRMHSEDRLRQEVIMGLACNLQVRKADIAARYGVDFDRHFAPALAALAPLAEDGLVTLGEDSLQVAPAGRPFLRNICMPFDAYLESQASAGVRYSATV